MSADSDILHERRRGRRRVIFWRIVALVLFIVLVFWGISDFTAEETGDHVARLNVSGIIVENDRRQEAIEQLADDKSVRAVLVYINSPGGSTYGSENLFKSLRRVADVKPVVTVIGTVGASGGYMTALAGDRVFAGESSIVGSIGVIVQLTEFSALMKKLGVSASAVTSGPLKGEPSPFKPISEAGRDNLQNMVNLTYDWFVGLVASRRPLDEAAVRKIADGRVMIGLAGVKSGLIDEIGGVPEARSWLESARQIPSSLPLLEVDYSEPKPLIARLLTGMLGKSVISERLTLDGLLSLWHPE